MEQQPRFKINTQNQRALLDEEQQLIQLLRAPPAAAVVSPVLRADFITSHPAIHLSSPVNEKSVLHLSLCRNTNATKGW